MIESLVFGGIGITICSENYGFYCIMIAVCDEATSLQALLARNFELEFNFMLRKVDRPKLSGDNKRIFFFFI